MAVSHDPSPRDVPVKATLFCPECDHQSQMDGDWNVVETSHHVRYRCPACETEIAIRPAATQVS